MFDIPVEVLILINSGPCATFSFSKEPHIHYSQSGNGIHLMHLRFMPRLGKNFYCFLRDFLDHHISYKEVYEEIQVKLNKKDITHE